MKEEKKLNYMLNHFLLNLNRRIEEVVHHSLRSLCSLRSLTNSRSWINFFLGLLANKH